MDMEHFKAKWTLEALCHDCLIFALKYLWCGSTHVLVGDQYHLDVHRGDVHGCVCADALCQAAST